MITLLPLKVDNPEDPIMEAEHGYKVSSVEIVRRLKRHPVVKARINRPLEPDRERRVGEVG